MKDRDLRGRIGRLFGRKTDLGQQVDVSTPVVEDAPDPILIFHNLPDATPEMVEARRKASAAKNHKDPEYEVQKELVIPNQKHIGEALLAPVVVVVASYGTTWAITATSATDGEEVFGRASYHGPKNNLAGALEAANDWIRDSAVWVPHQKEIPSDMAPYAGAIGYQLRGN